MDVVVFLVKKSWIFRFLFIYIYENIYKYIKSH